MRLIDMWPDCGATDWQALEEYAWVRALSGVQQSAVHHGEGDVRTHVEMVTKALVSGAGYGRLVPEERRIVWLAAVLHDIGKPARTRMEKEWISPGHSALGSRMAREILWREGVTWPVREQVAALVLWHQNPFHLVESAQATRRCLEIAEWCRWDLLTVLAEADAKGRICSDKAGLLDKVFMAQDWAQEHGVWQSARAWANNRTRFEYYAKPERALDYVAYDECWGDVVIMSGLPGSGKSHKARELARERGIDVISLDAIRKETKTKWGDEQSRVIVRAKELMLTYLRAKIPFVWDTTGIKRSRRAEIIGTVMRYGARAQVVALDSTRDGCMAGDSEREESGRVGGAVIDRLAADWTWPGAPECDYVSVVAARGRDRSGGVRSLSRSL